MMNKAPRLLTGSRGFYIDSRRKMRYFLSIGLLFLLSPLVHAGFLPENILAG